MKKLMIAVVVALTAGIGLSSVRLAGPFTDGAML